MKKPLFSVYSILVSDWHIALYPEGVKSVT